MVDLSGKQSLLLAPPPRNLVAAPTEAAEQVLALRSSGSAAATSAPLERAAATRCAPLHLGLKLGCIARLQR